MNKMQFKKFLASVLIVGQIAPALAAPVVQRTYDPDLIAQARSQVDSGNTDVPELSPVDAGDASGLHLSRSEIIFDTTPLGQLSPVQRISIVNKSSELALVSSMLVEGKGFVTASTCANVGLEPSTGSCEVFIYARPEVAGLTEGRLVFNTQGGQKLVAKLTANASAPRLVASPSAVSLKRYQGEPAEVTMVELSNAGNQFVVVGDLSISGDVSTIVVPSLNSCTGVTLEPGQFCSFGVQSFFNQVGSFRSEVLVPDVSSPAASMRFPVIAESVSQTGLECAPNCNSEDNPLENGGLADETSLLMTPPVTNYPAQAVGSSIAPLRVTLLNDGPKAYEITELVMSSNSGFTVDKVCLNRRLAPNEQCVATISGVVTQLGINNARLIAKRSGSTESLSVTLNVQGVSPLLVVPEVSFGTIQLGVPQAPKVVTLRNAGTASVKLGSLDQAAGRFALTADNCSQATLPSGGTCSVTVSFSPDVAASYSNAFKVPSDAGAFNLLATATVFKDRIESNLELSFTDVGLGTVSPAKVVTFTNTATQPSLIEAVSVAGSGFALVNDTCSGRTLNAAQSCTVGVTFAPSQIGTVYGSLTAVSAGTTLATTSMSGDSPLGLPTAVPATVVGGSMPFGDVVTGTFNLVNNGVNTTVIDGPLLVDNPSVFSLTGCQSVTLAPGQSCVVNYSFTAPNEAVAGVKVSANVVGRTLPVEVFQFSATPLLNGIRATPATFDFDKLINRSQSQSFIFSKFGALSQVATGVTLSQPQGVTNFSITQNTCTNFNFDNGNCTVTVTATVGAVTPERTASIRVTTNNSTGATVSLRLPEVVREAKFDTPEALAPVVLGTAANGVLTLRNTGDVPVSITSITDDSTDIVISSQTCTTAALAVGATCTVNYRINTVTTDARIYSGNIRANFLDNKGLATFNQTFVSVETLKPEFVVDPVSVTYPTITARTNSLSTTINVPRTIRLTHAANSPIATAALTAPTVPSGFFLSSNNCPSSLARGSSCEYGVQFFGTSSAKLHEGNFQIKPSAAPVINVPLSADVLPALTSVSPGEINNQTSATITIKGLGFTTGVTYVVKGANDVVATVVTRVDDSTLRATLPIAGIEVVGAYDLKVSAAGRPSAVLGGALNYQPPTQGVDWAVKDINFANARIGNYAINASGQAVACSTRRQAGGNATIDIIRNNDVNGDTWQSVLATSFTMCSNVVANPANRNQMVIWVSSSSNYVFPVSSTSVLRTTDGGATWAVGSIGNLPNIAGTKTDNSLNFFNGQFVFGPYTPESFDGVGGYVWTSTDGALWVRRNITRYNDYLFGVGSYVVGGVMHYFTNRLNNISTVSTDVNPFNTYSIDTTYLVPTSTDAAPQSLHRMLPNNAVRLLGAPGAPHMFVGQAADGSAASVYLMDLSKTYTTGTPGKVIVSNRAGLPGRPETTDMLVRDVTYSATEGAAYVMMTKGTAPMEVYLYKTFNGTDFLRASPYPAAAPFVLANSTLLGRVLIGPNGQPWVTLEGKIAYPAQ